MSSRLGQTIQRYNVAMSSATSESQPGLANDDRIIESVPQAPITSSIFPLATNAACSTSTSSSVGGVTYTASSVIQSAHNQSNLYQPRGYKGHRRGHSYGGSMNPPHQSGIHHHQLESRPSHPNTAHYGIYPSSTTSNWQKGHRRALSGCLPPTVGAVAWSSLRDLDTASGGNSFHGYHHSSPLRSMSPEITGRADVTRQRPLSPEVVLATGKSSPLSPVTSSENTADLRRKRSISEIERRLTVGSCRSSKNCEHMNGPFLDTSLDSMECGLGPCRMPQCFQHLANIKFFVFILAILVTLQQAVASGYVNSVITTIESRFEIPSRFVGMVASAYEMGNVITVMFVSYLGAKRHIPRWIAVGVLVMVVGCVVFTLPEFLTPAFRPPGEEIGRQQGVVNNTRYSSNVSALSSLRPDMRNGICHSANPQSSKFISDVVGGSPENSNNFRLHVNESGIGYPTVTKEELILSYGCTVEVVDEHGKATVKASEEQSYGHPLILFMLAQLLLGCGGSPLFTLGITYVDDHVPADSSSVYIGTVYAMAAFGPVLGFLVGAYFLSVPSSAVGPDGKFLGMWWGGYLIAGVLLLLSCMPFLTFPRISREILEEEEEGENKDPDNNLTSAKQQQNQRHDSFREEEDAEVEAACAVDTCVSQPVVVNGQTPDQYGQSIKDIPKSILRLITNSTYVVTCLGGCMELNIVSGFVVFLPKYLETQFELGKSQASLFVGGIAIPGACLGIFAGGYLVKRLALKPSGAAKFVLATNILCLVGYVLFFFLGCPNPNLAGGTVPYPNANGQNIGANHHIEVSLNLTSDCNVDCSCDNSMDPQLVCHNGITYYSPCHAGCAVNLTQCSCAGGETVTPGRCIDPPAPCNTLLPFMVVLFFMTGTVAVTQMPLLMIVLRSVSPEERSFALGMQFVIFRLFGYIPSPIIFGNVIDSACLLWKVKRCSTLLPAVSGRCLLYDIEDFRYKYVGVLSGLKLLALALFIYDFFMLKRIEERDEKEASSNGQSCGERDEEHKSRVVGDMKQNLHSGSIISLDMCKLTNNSKSASSPPPLASMNHKLSGNDGGVSTGNCSTYTGAECGHTSSNAHKSSSRTRQNSHHSKSPEREQLMLKDRQINNKLNA